MRELHRSSIAVGNPENIRRSSATPRARSRPTDQRAKAAQNNRKKIHSGRMETHQPHGKNRKRLLTSGSGRRDHARSFNSRRR